MAQDQKAPSPPHAVKKPNGKCQPAAKESHAPGTSRSQSIHKSPPGQATVAAMPLRRTSSVPIAAPTFKGAGFDADMEELLDQIAPTAEGDRIVQELASLVRKTMCAKIQEVEVFGFVSADLSRGTAFGVAVPEVDIVVQASPDKLMEHLSLRLSQGGGATAGMLDARKLQKSAIRVCTDILVSTGGFKFRRSAFRGREPKVTLLAPAHLGICDRAIPIDFTVNSVSPMHSAALLTECGQLDPKAKLLILAVKRWAKDRGICHAPKGHLPPYVWSLLAVYYLQVGVSDDAPLLPPLEDFAQASGLMAKDKCKGVAPKSKKTKWSPATSAAASKSVGELFKGFMKFYVNFDWRKEAVCVRTGERMPPGPLLPIHIVVQDDGSAEAAPCVEDPFDPQSNLGECATPFSIARLHEELQRAHQLCERDASLTELLEPWMPPDRGLDNQEEDADFAPSPVVSKAPQKPPLSRPMPITVPGTLRPAPGLILSRKEGFCTKSPPSACSTQLPSDGSGSPAEHNDNSASDGSTDR
eukprot:gnl/TRDRNA2_/TRDRNA2_176134_c0_seq3.p1 gnl/TRDRNA2_/TRDRNA2_176134_c0~~gnl/TRDRNA2_/TRDRNA2_176134_c0_seq3.p1  ORF type:complete len:619 (+),score=113.45 gnl/TRDRNA2_/TRDRNA2_176134_c0_seq3:279-1859(+)